MMTYPINLVLTNKLVVLIGGKGEIVGKLPGLIDVGARVRVIAPSADETVQQHAADGHIEWIARPYLHGDLRGAVLVVANTGHADINDAVWAEGLENGQLVNVMDVLPQCNWHAASLVRRGQLTISIGTGGAAPALAATLRKRFEHEFGPEYGTFLEHARDLRPEVKRRIPPFKRRAAFWYELVTPGSGLCPLRLKKSKLSKALKLVHEGRSDAYHAHVEKLLAKHESMWIEAGSMAEAKAEERVVFSRKFVDPILRTITYSIARLTALLG